MGSHHSPPSLSVPYLCPECKGRFSEFHLKCPECGAWNSAKPASAGESSGAVPLLDIRPQLNPRITTHVAQFNMLLGGGFVPGSSLLLIGAPGTGKSTLILQVLGQMNLRSLYVCGEESASQLKFRADRLNINSPILFLLSETNVTKLPGHIRQVRARILVIDSIQTVYSDLSDSLPGSVTQMRKCSYLLRRMAQENDLILIMIGQVTKQMRAAGPKLLEHAVDVVLFLEENKPGARTLSASKNRFGSTTPVCFLRMDDSGLVFSRGVN